MFSLNLLEDYRFCSIPEEAVFCTNPNLRKKVDEAGSFLPYFGNTAVFLLKEEIKQVLFQLQQTLFRAAAPMLAQPLAADTFHMTLHDLINGTVPDPEGMIRTGEQVRPLLAQWKACPPLRMKGTWMFNMVNTSIVLGLAPADADSFRRLEEMYDALERIIPLGYALTPHITLAYFKPGSYSAEHADVLRKVLHPVELDVVLDMTELVLQEFTDMNHYTNS